MYKLEMENMSHPPVIQEAAATLFDYFNMEGETGAVSQGKEAYEYLKQLLSNRIRYLVDNDMEQFLYVLYRIDVDEQKVKQVLATHPLDEAIDEIAVLIIDRQQQKVITRREYSTKRDDGDNELSW